MNEAQEQTLKQKKIMLAQSEHAPIIIELMKDCIEQVPILAETEWGTIVNAIKLDTQSSMLKSMVDHLEAIRAGSMHEPK